MVSVAYKGQKGGLFICDSQDWGRENGWEWELAEYRAGKESRVWEREEK